MTHLLSQPRRNLLMRLLIITFACWLIAVFTHSIWSGDFSGHLLISLGYGIAAVLVSALLQALLPQFHVFGRALLSIVLTLLLGGINAAYWILGGWDLQHLPKLFPGMLLALTITGALTFGFYFFEQKFRIQQALEIAKRQHAEQQQALLLAELKQLQSQIEPHFLFNTLANINALISLEPAKAQQLLSRLTSLLRHNLHASRRTLATLGDELALLEDYLAIQQMRLGERLHYRIDVSHECRQLPWVPMLLQPLVENAVVHGIEPSSNGGEIIIDAELTAHTLQLMISDNGVGFSEHASSKGHGLALDNIRQRLKQLFAEQAELQLQQRQPHGVTASISVPLKQLQQLTEGTH
ncbi:histidine kinase [Shewanella sp. A3A]|nr:histidine kinase [Shewanella ferrihydritica]